MIDIKKYLKGKDSEFLIEVNRLDKTESQELNIRLYSLLKDKQQQQERKWGDIMVDLYADKNLMRRSKLLHNIIDEKHVCKDNKCPIFKPLEDIDLELDDMPVYDLETLKQTYKEDSTVYKTLKPKIEELAFRLIHVFEEIYALATTKGTERLEEDREHERKIEWTKTMASYKLPTSMNYFEYEKMSQKPKGMMLKSDDPKLQIEQQDEDA